MTKLIYNSYIISLQILSLGGSGGARSSPEIDFYLSTSCLDKMHAYKGQPIDLVIYHAGCSDGHAAAAVADLFLESMAHKNGYRNSYQTQFLALPPSPEPVDVTGKSVLVLDLSFNRDQTMKMIESAKSFLVIDHHKTSREGLEDIPAENKMFDMNKCGATLAWEYFYTNSKAQYGNEYIHTDYLKCPDDHVPEFLQYVESRDIWTQRLPLTNEVFEITHAWSRDSFEPFQELMVDRVALDKVKAQAAAIKSYKDSQIDTIVSRKVTLLTVEIDGVLRIVAYYNTPLYISEAGHEILKRYPFADFACNMQYDIGHEETYVSFRSEDSRVDVSELAKRLGGGGHRNAAGAKLAGLHHRLPFRHVDVDLVWEVATGVRENIDWNGMSHTVVRVPLNKYTINFSRPMIELLKKRFEDIEGVLYEADKTQFFLNFETASLNTSNFSN